MGRSRNRRTTRAVSTNHRLRSSSNASPFSPSPVPYGKFAFPRSLYSSPSQTFSRAPIRKSRNLYESFTPTPRQLPPSRPSRIRVYNAPLPNISRKKSPSNNKAPHRDEEKSSMVCVRRNERREVLHATNKTGKGGQTAPVFNALSKIHCRRKK